MKSKESKMIESIPHLILWLYTLNLCIAFGAGLYESRITVPMWFRSSPGTISQWNPHEARTMNVGLRFWAFVTTGPLTLLTLGSLFAVNNISLETRDLWWASIVVTLVERGMTLGYFVPTMIALMNADQTNPTLTTRAWRWVQWGYLRLILAGIAWLTALMALTRF
jgi:hypothetical protein